MAIAIDVPVAGELARGRGGFYRASNDTPYVSDPTGALVKSGPRKGLAKRLPYGTPSSRGKQIENTYNLQKWGERRVVLGLGIDLALIADCHRLSQLDVDSDEYKKLADTIVMRAKDAAQASLAAERGTHGHALSEDSDEERDWILRAEAGENLGLPTDVQRSLVDAWNAMLERNELEILAVEASCVDDVWRLAGTLDRIALCRKALRFARFGGETVEIPAGTRLVLDIKTGKRRLDRNGVVQYWQAYAIQIASYAQSKPYDTEAETRSEWPWPISQDHALIAHLDVLGALDGNPTCELVYVDLAAGREHGGETVVQARAWEDRTDVFSIAQLDDAPGITAEPDPPQTMTAIVCSRGKGCTTVQLPVPAAEAVTPAASAPPAPEEPPTSGAPTEDSSRSAATATVGGEATPTPPPTVAEQREALTGVWAGTRPDEGDDIDQTVVDALRAHHDAVPAGGRAWFKRLFVGAAHAGVSFHLAERRTVRRFEIVRGLIALAHAGVMEDEAIRLLVATAMDDNAAMFPSIEIGHCVGALSAEQAHRFALLADDLIAGALVYAVDDDGTTRLRHPVAV